jgi:hypothetical protein
MSLSSTVPIDYNLNLSYQSMRLFNSSLIQGCIYLEQNKKYSINNILDCIFLDALKRKIVTSNIVINSNTCNFGYINVYFTEKYQIQKQFDVSKYKDKIEFTKSNNGMFNRIEAHLETGSVIEYISPDKVSSFCYTHFNFPFGLISKEFKHFGCSAKKFYDLDSKEIDSTSIISSLKQNDKHCYVVYSKPLIDTKIIKKDDDDFGSIYLLREREFVKLNEHVYKIGMTNRNMSKRFSEYPKDSELIFTVAVPSKLTKITEADIIKEYISHFKQRTDVGVEYFEGNYKEMIKIIVDYVIKI